jgi:hypothetical protein
MREALTPAVIKAGPATLLALQSPSPGSTPAAWKSRDNKSSRVCAGYGALEPALVCPLGR